MKRKINKLELQIGLECERGGPQACPPRTSPSSHGSASHHPVRAVCDSGGQGVEWLGEDPRTQAGAAWLLLTCVVWEKSCQLSRP